MAKYDVVFYGIIFFLIGVLLANFLIKTSLIIILAAVIAIIFLFLNFPSRKNIWLAGLAFLIILGNFYYRIDDMRFQNVKIPFGQSVIVRGTVVSEPARREKSQSFVVKLIAPRRGRILVKADRYEDIKYGDLLSIKGKIKKRDDNKFGMYLAKERISGIVTFADINRVASDRGSKFKAALFKIKNKALDIFRQALPSAKATFLGGITFGARSNFSKEFNEAMSLSGTTHLVALSGYNVTIIAWAVAGIFGYFFKRRLSFIMTVLVIIGFVLMTGAAPSIIRAAIMGIIALLAHQTLRLYNFRNAIAITAFLMVAFNPKILVYDLGFQLSFLALLGIVYLRPAIISFFKISERPGLLSWRDNALTTVSAQLAVIPLLLLSFGRFSLAAFPANILILGVIPITMFLGFLMALFGIISFPLALLIGWIANIFLSYELFLIDLFARFKILVINTGYFIIPISLVYFLALILFIIYAKKKEYHRLTTL